MRGQIVSVTVSLIRTSASLVLQSPRGGRRYGSNLCGAARERYVQRIMLNSCEKCVEANSSCTQI